MLALAQLCFDRGDLKRLAIIARRLRHRSDLSVEELLRVARLTRWEDPELARSLWRQAVPKGIPDQLVGEAVTLAYALGLDRELDSLRLRVTKLGLQERGGIQVGKVQDVIAHAKRYSERAAELDQAYRSGEAPVHVIAEELNWPLVELYHGILEKHEDGPDPLRHHPL
ncbi:MAG: hypothetical protein ACOC6F_03185, partial [bacterium]